MLKKREGGGGNTVEQNRIYIFRWIIKNNIMQKINLNIS